MGQESYRENNLRLIQFFFKLHFLSFASTPSFFLSFCPPISFSLSLVYFSSFVLLFGRRNESFLSLKGNPEIRFSLSSLSRINWIDAIYREWHLVIANRNTIFDFFLSATLEARQDSRKIEREPVEIDCNIVAHNLVSWHLYSKLYFACTVLLIPSFSF